MKVPSILPRLQILKTPFQGPRLILVLVIAVLLVSAASVSAYVMIGEEKKTPVAEKVDSKPAVSANKVDAGQPTAVEEQPAATEIVPTTPPAAIQPAATQTNKPAAQVTKPRPGTSEDPAFVACIQKMNDLYVKYNADNADINAEKSLALAIIDELYNTGFYDEHYPGDTEPYNQWQIDRAELEAEYNNQLAILYSTYAAESSPYQNC